MVLEKTMLSAADHTFTLTLRTGMRSKFTSGGLLAVNPESSGRERFYSISKSHGNIQLVVKLHQPGFGSEYLYGLKAGAIIKACITPNPTFHFPKKAPAVAMIANGTGIAPFLGMIESNKCKTECHLYCGFRNETTAVTGYKLFAHEHLKKQKLNSFNVVFSRE